MTVEQYLANAQSIAALIDHTLLKPEAAEDDIARLCDEAVENGFCSVCVNPGWVRFAHHRLTGFPVRTCAVVGFPLGATTTAAKLAEAREALSHGASELDMVQNVGALRSGHLEFVQAEIAELAELAHSHGALLKVILETCLLDETQKTISSRLAADAQADFVKTSTGFSTGGATEGDVRLMRSVVGPSIGVKASGGIRTLETLQRMVEAGANRIGASAGIKILREVRGTEKSSAPSGGY